MRNLASTGTTTSTLPDQSSTASLTVETMTDLDNGQSMLIASTHGNQGDLQVVTTSQALAMITEQHHKLDQSALLALSYEAHTRSTRTADGHFPWCEASSCFVSEPDEHGEYVDHQGPVASVHAPQNTPAVEGTLLRARLCSDAADLRGATVSISGSNGNGTLLTSDELDPVIDELAAFVDQLRAMRLQLKVAGS
jgi:hypothetical protein